MVAAVGEDQGGPFGELGVLCCEVGLEGEEGREGVLRREEEGLGPGGGGGGGRGRGRGGHCGCDRGWEVLRDGMREWGGGRLMGIFGGEE